MNFITVTSVEGQRLRIKESRITSWCESSSQFPGSTMIVYEEAGAAVSVFVKETIEEVDAKVTDANAFEVEPFPQ